MLHDFCQRCGRYCNCLLYVKNKSFYVLLNNFLTNKSLSDFLNYSKLDEFVQFYSESDFSIITLYNKLDFKKQHYIEMLKILKQKYFYKLHQLLCVINDDFPLYSDYVQLMFEYMVDDQVKLSDCVSQTTGDMMFGYLNWDYDKFFKIVNDMMLYCKNEDLKKLVQQKVINRLIEAKKDPNKMIKTALTSSFQRPFDLHCLV